MFENSGEKLKKVVIVLFWLSIIGYVLLAFAFGWEEYYSSARGRYSVFNAVYFFTFLIGGPLVSYISTLVLVAFADLVENTQYIKKATEEIKKNKAE